MFRHTRMLGMLIVVALTIGGWSCKELIAPRVPVACCRRASRVGQGQVIRVRNTTGKVLALWFESNGKQEYFSLQPYDVKEFGWLEGFTFGENSTYTVGGEGYASVTFSKSDEAGDC